MGDVIVDMRVSLDGYSPRVTRIALRVSLRKGEDK
jgi:hypothetical protein